MPQLFAIVHRLVCIKRQGQETMWIYENACNSQKDYTVKSLCVEMWSYSIRRSQKLLDGSIHRYLTG